MKFEIKHRWNGSKDIAAIPTATDGKFRVHRCKIVGEKDISALVGSAS